MGEYTIEGDFNWMAYKAQVAATMLPHIYEEAKSTVSGGLRSAKDTAIDDAIEMAVDMAEKLEIRLKGREK